MGILYSMCWEDPAILLEALNISERDRVLSICSGGENIFAILLKNPKRIIAIDINKEQIYLAKLKVTAIKNLSYEEFVQFIGFKPYRNRITLFNKLKGDLSNKELDYWNNNIEKIRRGVVHSGKIERYLGKFRRFLLPFITSRTNLKNFIQLNTLKEQEEFFSKVWDNWRFRFLFTLFFSKKGMNYGRKRDYFKYSEQNNLTSYYFERTKHGLTKVPIKSNFFMQYILLGTIPIPFKSHPYLDKENYNKLNSLINKIEFIHSNLDDYIRKSKPNSFTKFNLSDIFELKTQEQYEAFMREIVKITNKEGVACYWNNLVPRYKHKKIIGLIKDKSLSILLSKKDRCHFYSRFIVERIKTK